MRKSRDGQNPPGTRCPAFLVIGDLEFWRRVGVGGWWRILSDFVRVLQSNTVAGGGLSARSAHS